MKRIQKILYITLIALFVALPVAAQEVPEAPVEAYVESVTMDEQGMELVSRTEQGQEVITMDTAMLPQSLEVRPGMSYVFERTQDGGFVITDVVRRPALLILFALFVLVVVAVTRWKGVRSLLGMAVSFGLLFWVLLPAVLAGANPIMMAIVISVLLVPVTFFLTHGWNRKSIAASIGTVAALIVTGLLAYWSMNMALLTGTTSEEITFLQMFYPDGINAKGLLLAGVIISLLGILDDVTMTQAAVTNKLKHTNPKLTKAELFHRSLDVGKDHIASLVNTLVLVYVGASLPLMLLFMNDALPWHQVLNAEIVAEEVIRTLVGSIGLVLAVPFTTLLAVWLVKGEHAEDHGGCAH